MSDVTLIDMECGNTASIEFALEREGAAFNRTQTASEIAGARRLILPGVGAAAFAMAKLRELGLEETISRVTQPLLGICLGMQILYERSEEGDVPCLGLLPGVVRRLQGSIALPVPHMGWSPLRLRQRENDLVAGVENGAYVYFVHGFACPVRDETCVAAAEYDGEFAAMVQSRNIYGCQFHPERSATVGRQILQNFLRVPC